MENVFIVQKQALEPGLNVHITRDLESTMTEFQQKLIEAYAAKYPSVTDRDSLVKVVYEARYGTEKPKKVSKKKV